MIKSDGGAALAHVSAGRSSRQSTVGAVLVLHGGSADSVAPTQWRNLAILRLWPVARVIARRLPDVTVFRLRFSVRGWNGNGRNAIDDARWALAQLRTAHAGVPIVVVGHSMGGRVAAQIAADPDVAGVVLLAPWVPAGDPADQLAGVPVVAVQGGRDRTIPLAATAAWLSHAESSGATLTRTILPWAEHTMLLGFWVWHRLAAEAVRTVLLAARVGLRERPPD